MAQVTSAGSGAAWIDELPAGPTSAAAGLARYVRRVLLHFLELQVPMVVGAVVCYLLLRLIPASSSLASVYYPGSYLYATGDLFFLTVPGRGMDDLARLWMAA